MVCCLSWQKVEILKPIAKEHQQERKGNQAGSTTNQISDKLYLNKEVAKIAKVSHDTAEPLGYFDCRLPRLPNGQKELV